MEDIKDLETTVWRVKEGRKAVEVCKKVSGVMFPQSQRKRQEAEVQVAAKNVEVVFGSDEDQE